MTTGGKNWQQYSLSITLLRLHHSADASTFTGFKLMCFVYILCCFRRNKLR